MVSVKAAAMKTPCATRSAAKTAKSGMKASAEVGSARRASDSAMARRRSTRRARSATRTPEAAMPKVHALTAKPIAAGEAP